MNLRYLDYLRLVIEHGSFAAAAQAGGVSQPAISHGIRQLQRLFDTPLFTTSGRRKIPTATALQAALKAADLAGRVEALGIKSANADDAGAWASTRTTLRVGLTSSAALVLGPVLYKAWFAAQPGGQLEMSTANEALLLASLQAGTLDFVISPKPRGQLGAGLEGVLLYRIAPQVYARAAHPRVQARSLAELLAAGWAVVGPSVSGPVDVLSEAHSVRRLKAPDVRVSCPDYASLLHLVAHSDLLCVLPHPALLASAAQGQVMALQLREALPLYGMHLFTRQPVQAALRPVIVHLQQHVAGFDEASNPVL